MNSDGEILDERGAFSDGFELEPLGVRFFPFTFACSGDDNVDHSLGRDCPYDVCCGPYTARGLWRRSSQPGPQKKEENP